MLTVVSRRTSGGDQLNCWPSLSYQSRTLTPPLLLSRTGNSLNMRLTDLPIEILDIIIENCYQRGNLNDILNLRLVTGATKSIVEQRSQKLLGKCKILITTDKTVKIIINISNNKFVIDLNELLLFYESTGLNFWLTSQRLGQITIENKAQKNEQGMTMILSILQKILGFLEAQVRIEHFDLLSISSRLNIINLQTTPDIMNRIITSPIDFTAELHLYMKLSDWELVRRTSSQLPDNMRTPLVGDKITRIEFSIQEQQQQTEVVDISNWIDIDEARTMIKEVDLKYSIVSLKTMWELLHRMRHLRTVRLFSVNIFFDMIDNYENLFLPSWVEELEVSMSELELSSEAIITTGNRFRCNIQKLRFKNSEEIKYFEYIQYPNLKSLDIVIKGDSSQFILSVVSTLEYLRIDTDDWLTLNNLINTTAFLSSPITELEFSIKKSAIVPDDMKILKNLNHLKKIVFKVEGITMDENRFHPIVMDLVHGCKNLQMMEVWVVKQLAIQVDLR